MVSVDRWSLYGGPLAQLKWTMSQSTVVYIDKQVVFLCEWSLRQVALYSFILIKQSIKVQGEHETKGKVLCMGEKLMCLMGIH